MTEFFDWLDTPVQVGGDLQEHDAGTIQTYGHDNFNGERWTVYGFDYQDPFTYFGPTQPTWSIGPTSMVDMVMHQGKLHVVWVELEDDGAGDHFVRGPYVKRYDGPGWTLLGGGPVEDDAYSQQGRYDTDRYTDPSWLPLGNRTYPSRPRIASDGTNLYVAYSIRVGSYAADPPPVGSYTYLDPYGHTVLPGEHLVWWPRWVIARQWNGASWDEIGNLPATTNNSFNEGGGAKVCDGGDRVGLCASPADVGTCYISFAETGTLGIDFFYILHPFFFVGFVFGSPYCPYIETRLRVAQISGGVQTTKEIFAGSAHDGLCGNTTDTANRTYNDYEAMAPHKITNEEGPCVIVWGSDYTTSGSVPATAIKRFTSWDTLTDLQTYTVDPSIELTGIYTDLAHDDDRGVFYFDILPRLPGESRWVRQITDDFSSPVDFIDSDTSAETNPPFNALPEFAQLATDDPENIWALQTYRQRKTFGFESPPVILGPYIWLYHRPCKKWDQVILAAPVDDPMQVAGDGAILIDGDTLYLANAYYDLTGVGTPPQGDNLRVRVLAYPILRDEFSCGEVGPTGVTLRSEMMSLPFVAGTNVQSS